MATREASAPVQQRRQGDPGRRYAPDAPAEAVWWRGAVVGAAAQQADIPPVLAIFAVIAGAAVGGILGALVAIPLFGALRVLVVRVVAPAVRRWSGAAGAPVADEAA